MIIYNGADPKECAWAEREMAAQRRMRLACGETVICNICQRDAPTAWMVDGHCGPHLAPRVWVCAPPIPERLWKSLWRSITWRRMT